MPHRLLLVFSLLIIAMPAVHAQEKDENGWLKLRCNTLPQCLAYVSVSDCVEDASACEIGFIDASKGYLSLPQEFDKFGREAVPKLLELLSASDLSVRQKAAYMLSESRYLEARDREPIVKAQQAGVSGIDEAAAKLDDGKLLAVALQELRAQPVYQGKSRVVDAAYDREEKTKEFIKAIARHQPDLLRPVLACWKSTNCDDTLFYRVSRLLPKEAPKGETGSMLHSDILLDVLTSPTETPIKRGFLIAALELGRFLGEPTSTLRDNVSFYANSNDEDVKLSAVELLRIWKDKRSVAGQLSKIKSESGWRRAFAIREFADTGVAAKDAAPEIATYLVDSDWDVRATAAYALGEIGATDHIAELAASVTDSDWVLSYRIVDALALLDPQDKSGKRRELATQYWHPAVRDLAQRSLAGPIVRDKRAMDWFSPTRDYCSSLVPLSDRLGSRPNEDIDATNKRTDEAYAQYDRRLDEVTEFQSATPVTNGKTYDGAVFQGASMGEFGGSLTVTENGVSSKIFDDNVDAIIRVTAGIFAVNTQGHMSIDYGYLVKVSRESGKWVARKVFRLQGFTNGVYQTGDRLMFVGNGASMWLDENMKPHWITCGPV
jgi:HEAT repeat protein